MSKPPFLCQDISQVATEKDALRDQIRDVKVLRDIEAENHKNEIAKSKKALEEKEKELATEKAKPPIII
jgi:hypothetical protein